MFIKCWGSRGSIPVSGKEYVKYGGDSTCIEIRSKNNDILIIDAGSGIRRLGNLLLNENQNNLNLLFTHAHWDHLLGFPFFKPIYTKKTKIALYGCPFAQESVKNIISGTMQRPNFPIDYEKISASITYNTICEKKFKIGSINISTTLLSHPNEGIGYKFEEDGKTFVFLTDNELTHQHPGGLLYNDYLNFSKNSDLLIHDSEFKKEEYEKLTKTWGHSIYNDALKLALESNVKTFGLFHHNQERTDKQIDEILQNCKKIIKEKKSNLNCIAVATGTEFNL